MYLRLALDHVKYDGYVMRLPQRMFVIITGVAITIVKFLCQC
jgi:hypothetical protein